MSSQAFKGDDDNTEDRKPCFNRAALVAEYLLKHEPIYRRLSELRSKGWANPKGDEHFQKQRKRADGATKLDKERLFNMMKQIGDELQQTTKALDITTASDGIQPPLILDLCMAPGGYTASALKYNPGASVFGITLDSASGGHDVLLHLPRDHILYADITMLANEFGGTSIPPNHPHPTEFLDERPFLGKAFDLVFCDGQVLRTHERPEYREVHEARRLTNAQLILALQRIKVGGTMIILLHKAQAWDTIELLQAFSRFATIELFKPKKKHAVRSSFYMIARNVQSESVHAKEAVETWKADWWRATFGGESGTGEAAVVLESEYAENVLESFGPTLISLARGIWNIQAEALSRASFLH